ncbi:unnamed protein product [Protopolystoma xenopodis]|uniref:Uncharacterized protein n=1 Tax=Protopolystoma xenopodis TaxID=117903 RepID=A0A448XPY1_9PLAT|nr:unnamed protein product [Protopolystoma xenopodis]
MYSKGIASSRPVFRRLNHTYGQIRIICARIRQKTHFRQSCELRESYFVLNVMLVVQNNWRLGSTDLGLKCLNFIVGLDETTLESAIQFG